MGDPLVANPPLIVDDRQDKHFTAALMNFFDVTVKHLPSGDLVFTCPLGRVGVEDKAMGDYKQSLRNNRLDDELRRLEVTYAVPVLFLRGVQRIGSQYETVWEEHTIEKGLFGRQLHGVYTFRSRNSNMLAQAEDFHRLYEYLQYPGRGGIEGVRREKVKTFRGPLGPRAEVIYGILGAVGGVKNRRAVAESIAATATLSEFLRWRPLDFEVAGFTRHMADKVSAFISTLEVPSGTH